MPVSRCPGTGDCCAVPPVPGCAVACRQATPGRPAGKPGVLPSIRRGGEPVPAGDAPPQPLSPGRDPGEQRPPLTVRDPGATTVRGDDAGRLVAGVSGRGCAGGRCNLGGGCHRVTASGRQRFRAERTCLPGHQPKSGRAQPALTIVALYAPMPPCLRRPPWLPHPRPPAPTAAICVAPDVPVPTCAGPAARRLAGQRLRATGPAPARPARRTSSAS